MEPTRVSIMFDGRIVKEGGPELVEQLERGATGGSATRSRRRRRSRDGRPRTDTALAREFPVLEREGLVYLDSSATSQKPRVVIDAIEDYYARHNANIHRGVYPLAVEATDLYEGGARARRRLAGLDAAGRRSSRRTPPRRSTSSPTPGAGATSARATRSCSPQMEHHSNIVPWQLLCQEVGAELRYLEVDDDGQVALDQLDACLADGRVRLVAAVARLQRRWARSTRSARDRPPRTRAGARVADRRLAGRAAAARRRRARSAPTSTSGPGTRPTARPASACSTGAASCSRRCRRSSAAAT